MEKPVNNQRLLIANIYTTYHDELVGFATVRLGNHDEAQDLVQDAFIKMMDYEGLIGEATAKSFAFTITANKIKDTLRRRIFRRRMEEGKRYEMQLQYDSVERVVEYRETALRMQRGIDSLSPSCARVYRMSLFEDMTAGDISAQLGVSKRTVESQLFTSRKKMREYMRKEA